MANPIRISGALPGMSFYFCYIGGRLQLRAVRRPRPGQLEIAEMTRPVGGTPCEIGAFRASAELDLREWRYYMRVLPSGAFTQLPEPPPLPDPSPQLVFPQLAAQL